MKSKRPGKIIRRERMKRITFDSQPIESPEESLIKFIKKEKQVSYRTLQAHYPGVPETSLRRKIYFLTRNGVLKREKCLCGQGWIYEIN